MTHSFTRRAGALAMIGFAAATVFHIPCGRFCWTQLPNAIRVRSASPSSARPGGATGSGPVSVA